MNLLFDIETDSLNPTTIWCIAAYDVDNQVMHSFKPDSIDQGIELLQKADKLIGHTLLDLIFQ